MTIVDCKHENTTKNNPHDDMPEIDGVTLDLFAGHVVCYDCQSHIDCSFGCNEYRKYLRMMGVEVDFPDGPPF